MLDNGVGLAPTRASFRPGIGLKNAKSRLTQLYGDDHRFELRSGENGGTVVALEIPFRSRALLADEPPPDWSATGEWSMMQGMLGFRYWSYDHGKSGGGIGVPLVLVGAICIGPGRKFCMKTPPVQEVRSQAVASWSQTLSE